MYTFGETKVSLVSLKHLNSAILFFGGGGLGVGLRETACLQEEYIVSSLPLISILASGCPAVRVPNLGNRD